MNPTGTRSFLADNLPLPHSKSLSDFEVKKEELAGFPLDIEIGPGVGLHPILYAKNNPERFLVAIEHTREKFLKFKRRHDKHPQLNNLLALHANAISWVHYALAPKSVSRCFLLYPNPSPKKKDLSKRWHAMPFMGRLLEVLKPDGEIVLATNKEDYATEAKEWMKEKWDLTLIEEKELTLKNWPPSQHRTHFERKYLERGETCFNLVFSNNHR